MPIYYTMSIDSLIHPRQRSIFPTMQPQFPARKRAISEEKRKRRGEKKKKSAWPTVHEFVPLETFVLDAFAQEIILFVAQLPRVPLLDFLGCTYFMSAPICFEGRVLLVAREKSFAARSYDVNTSHLEGFKESWKPSLSVTLYRFCFWS